MLASYFSGIYAFIYAHSCRENHIENHIEKQQPVFFPAILDTLQKC
jgi:hypothetical protein